MKLLVLNGPNINMLGKREPGIYGHLDYAALEKLVVSHGHQLGITVDVVQSNVEGELINVIHDAVDYTGLIVNAGAFTHTSIALRDALLAVQVPFIEVHLSNVYAREDFRKHSYLSDIAVGVIGGLKEHSYLLAIDYFAGQRKN